MYNDAVFKWDLKTDPITPDQHGMLIKDLRDDSDKPYPLYQVRGRADYIHVYKNMDDYLRQNPTSSSGGRRKRTKRAKRKTKKNKKTVRR